MMLVVGAKSINPSAMASNNSYPVGGLHTPRLEARQEALEATFSEASMKGAWKDYVRPGLRRQEVLDLFDYNDFHWNKDARFSDLQRAILLGRYKPSGSIPTKLEKSQGVCRTVVTPSPEDALVLQCIVEMILPKATKKQPSPNAFFSRSHKSAAGSFTFGRDYIWFRQWRRFSTQRMSITSSHAWVATTDISTYFDNIHYSHLRNIISSLGEIEEVLLDLLFSVLDTISWRPDYLPSSGVGIPQVQFDAPRLLAHVYLFEIDSFLKKRTQNCFVRWVDDITFAVDSRQEAKKILRDLDLLLQMRGVRLNSGKTKVLSAAQARRFFFQRENEYLNRVKARIDGLEKAGASTRALETSLGKSFSKFVAREPYGHSDKIVKRYLGHFAEIGSELALPYCLSRLDSDPGLRDTIYRYLLALGPSPRSVRALIGYLTSEDALDDASLCQIAKLLTDWEIDPKSTSFRLVRGLIDTLSRPERIQSDNYRFLAPLWLISKYSNQARLRTFLEETEEIWKHSEFLSRQAMAAAAKFRNRKHFSWMAKRVERHSFQSSLSVLSSLETLKSYTNAVPPDVRLYILNGQSKGTYSVQRFLIAMTVLGSRNLEPVPKAQLKAALLGVLRDPHYVAVVNAI